mgnify:CR=1 FL=1
MLAMFHSANPTVIVWGIADTRSAPRDCAKNINFRKYALA